MHTILRTTVAGLALASLGIASSASAATATADAQAQILASLSVTNDDDLDFGGIANNGTGGTVQMDPDTGALLCPVLICAAAGTPATFDVVGASGLEVDISFTDSNIDLVDPISSETMPLALDSEFDTAFLSVGATGTLSFGVGGTLTVAANQAPGTYTGQMEVQVLYN